MPKLHQAMGSLYFEFDVASIWTIAGRGTAAAGWIRRGNVRVGDRVLVLDGLIPIASTVRAVGFLSGPGPKAGGPNVELILVNDEATRRLAPGVRIVAAPTEDTDDIAEAGDIAAR
jgi:translation elongation factor EF-Tu-like GTPase